jgi:tetratricopeptide (TPR) repeat protein
MYARKLSMRFFGNSAEQIVARGVECAAKGQFDLAVADFEEAIRLDPKCADAFYNRANAYAEQRQYDRAIADYDAAIKLNPNDVSAAIKSRATAIALKNGLDGKTDADAAATAKMASTEFAAHGVANRDKGEHDRTNGNFDETIRRYPKEAGAFGLRGGAYAAKGQFDRAVADFDEAIRLDPKEASAFNGRACRYLIKGQFDRAIADFDEAIRLDPNFTMAIEMRAIAMEWKNELGARTERVEQKSNSIEPVNFVEESNRTEAVDDNDIDYYDRGLMEDELPEEPAREANDVDDTQVPESPNYGDEFGDSIEAPAHEAMDPELNGVGQELVSEVAAVEANDARSVTFKPIDPELSEDEQEIRNAIYEQAEALEAIFQKVRPGRHRSLALIRLEESVMWIVKAQTS